MLSCGALREDSEGGEPGAAASGTDELDLEPITRNASHMRRFVIIAVAFTVLLGLSGCRLFEKKPKDKSAEPASRTKDKDKDWLRDRQDRPPPDWLDSNTPAASRGARVPPAADPTSDPRKASGRVLSGVIEDEYGKPMVGAYITVENADPIKAGYGAPMGVESTQGGVFEINGLTSGEHYMLSCAMGKQAGRVAVQVPNTQIRLRLREDYRLPPSRTPSDLPPTVPPGGPTPKVFDGPSTATPKNDDWSPVPGARPDAHRGDLVAPGPANEWKPPAASIPGPTAPPVPPLGPTSKAPPRDSKFVVLDSDGKARNVLTGKPEDLVLLDFVTSTCGPCKKAIPALVSFNEKHGRSAEVIAVMCDGDTDAKRVELANRYRSEQRIPYVVFAESSRAPLADQFHVEFYPTLVLLDGTGRRLWKGHPKDLAEAEKIIRSR